MKNRRIAVLMILLITLASTVQAFAAKKETPQKLPAKNSNVSVIVGKSFIVELKDSDGKAWSYAITANEPDRKIMEIAFEPKNDGIRKWEFMGVTVGQCTLIFTCTDQSGASPKTIKYEISVGNEPEIREKLNVKKGKTFTIALEQNPSTGYVWTYTIEPATGIELVDDVTAENDRQGAVGAPSKRVFTFKGVQKGRYIVTFTYSRMFAPEDHPQSVKYDILIK